MKKYLNILVVDDERLARKDLISMLINFGIIGDIEEADCVGSAIDKINEKLPDIIFLDIQMPGGNGFELLDKTDINAEIIFVTAYDEYAIRAFEVNALDYLLKPVEQKRLEETLKRLSSKQRKIKSVLRKLQYDDRLFLLIDSHYKFINIRDIIYIKSAGDYTEVYLVDSRMNLTLKTMKEWELRLPEKHFCRIHRSTIISIECIERIEEWFNYSFKVFLTGIKEPVILSRRYASALKEKYG